MVKKPIANARFVNIARFWIVNTKSLIRSVAICLLRQFAVQFEYVIGQMNRKLLNVFASALAFEEFAPCDEQVFHRNDIIVGMKKAGTSSLSLSLSVAPRSSVESKRVI